MLIFFSVVILIIAVVITNALHLKHNKLQDDRITRLFDKVIIIETRIHDNVVEYPKALYADHRNPETGLLGRKRK